LPLAICRARRPPTGAAIRTPGRATRSGLAGPARSGWCRAALPPGTGTLPFNGPIVRRRCGDEDLQQRGSGRRDGLDSPVEGRLIDLRRPSHATYLADVLERGGTDFVRAGGRPVVVKGLNRSAHSPDLAVVGLGLCGRAQVQATPRNLYGSAEPAPHTPIGSMARREEGKPGEPAAAHTQIVPPAQPGVTPGGRLSLWVGRPSPRVGRPMAGDRNGRSRDLGPRRLSYVP
jgi:hypothetical protein